MNDFDTKTRALRLAATLTVISSELQSDAWHSDDRIEAALDLLEQAAFRARVDAPMRITPSPIALTEEEPMDLPF